ncbi:MAG: hypothetical protein V5B38_23755 [Candidatus Accumulibacter propinquus]
MNTEGTGRPDGLIVSLLSKLTGMRISARRAGKRHATLRRERPAGADAFRGTVAEGKRLRVVPGDATPWNSIASLSARRR